MDAEEVARVARCRICGDPMIGKPPMAIYCGPRCRRQAEFARRKLPGRRRSLAWWTKEVGHRRGPPARFARAQADRLEAEVAELERRAGEGRRP